MHLGQTATFLAQVFNRPEPTLQMLARLLRDAPEQWVKKGGRGRSAHHLESKELSNFIVAMMACPDSPAQALDRLPHFASLSPDPEAGHKSNFGDALAILLERLAAGDLRSACERNWRVTLAVDISSASIMEDHQTDDGRETKEHFFGFMTYMPYRGGLSCTVQLHWTTLFRIAKVVLANDSDPLDEVAQAILEVA